LTSGASSLLEKLRHDEPGKQKGKRNQADGDSDPDQQDLLFMLFIRRSDPHYIVENPHHGEKSLHGIFRNWAPEENATGCVVKRIIKLKGG